WGSWCSPNPVRPDESQRGTLKRAPRRRQRQRLSMKNCPSCTKLSRRELLSSAATWAAFAALARRGDAQVNAVGVNPRSTARACIFINLNGAPSHLDTFDVKDAAWNPDDADIRQYPGGIALSNTLFPEMSKITNDLLLLRSVRSW